MKARQHASCWELFVNAMPSFNASLLKMLSVMMLLSSTRVCATDSNNFKFFSRGDNFPAKTLDRPCVQAYPGDRLVVSLSSSKDPYGLSSPKDYYHVAQAHQMDHLDQKSLETQLIERSYVGDIFCDGKLQTVKKDRLQPLQGKNYANSDYTVDLNDLPFVGIEFINNDEANLSKKHHKP